MAYHKKYYKLFYYKKDIYYFCARITKWMYYEFETRIKYLSISLVCIR